MKTVVKCATTHDENRICAAQNIKSAILTDIESIYLQIAYPSYRVTGGGGDQSQSTSGQGTPLIGHQPIAGLT